MATIGKSIEVDVPLTTVYNQWTQFEEFPAFMEGVQEVKQMGDERLYWRAEIAGVEKGWYAKIAEQVPDQLVAWYSEGGAANGGEVAFQAIDDSKTLVTLTLTYEPDDIVEAVGDKLGFVSRRVEGDLNRFKEFIELRGEETGAWRGKIEESQRDRVVPRGRLGQ